MKTNSRKTTILSSNSPFIYNLKDKTVYDSYKSFKDNKLSQNEKQKNKLSNYTDISTTIGNNESLKKNRLLHNSLYTINDINSNNKNLNLSNEYDNLKPRETSYNYNKTSSYLPELKLNNVILNFKYNKRLAKSKPKQIHSKSIQTEYKIRLKSYTNMNSYEYNDNITTFENMKEMHNPKIKSLKSRVIKKINYNKEFIDLKGNKIDEYSLSPNLMNNDKKIKIQNIPYSKVTITDFIERIRKHNDNSNLKEEQISHFARKSTDKTYNVINKNDVKMYKDIFDRPIIFKDSNNKEFKLSDKEYDIIYDNKLADNIEQDENKLLITNKKSWLVKGIIDHVYPKVMIIRTNLVRNGLIKK